MNRLYLITLEIVPLGLERTYDTLPSHLTLMSRFTTHLLSEELTKILEPVFINTAPIKLTFGETIALGPKRVTAHMVESSNEQQLHEKLITVLDLSLVKYQYPQFMGHNHKPHITAREGRLFPPNSVHYSHAAYLIEVVDHNRLVKAKYKLNGNEH
jgi:hypothetical protein